jgi:hypothetical protein
MTRNGPTNEHCDNHEDNNVDDETPSNDDDKEMVDGLWNDGKNKSQAP